MGWADMLVALVPLRYVIFISLYLIGIHVHELAWNRQVKILFFSFPCSGAIPLVFL
jgi:hypothetical protein